MPDRSSPVLLSQALCFALLLLAGCTTSTSEGGNATDSSTTVATSVPETSSSTPQSSTTTLATESDTAPTIAELRAALPGADAAGADFTAVDVTADPQEAVNDDALTRSMADGCPPSKKLMDTDSGDPSTYAGRLFNADDSRQIGVFLLRADDPRTGFTDKAELDELVEATAKCPQITTTDRGVRYNVDLDGSPSGEFGTYGATIGADIELTAESLQSPATIHMDLLIFQVGAVDVMVQTVSGLGSDGTESPVDPSIANEIATGLEQRLSDLRADR